MKVAIFANTPAQLHLYRHLINDLSAHGHDIKLLLRDAGETISVANELKIDYAIYSRLHPSMTAKITQLPKAIITACNKLQNFRPSIVVGSGIYDAFTSVLLRAPCIEFEDSEPMVNKITYSVQLSVYMPFVDAVITPSSFRQDLGEKHIRIDSFKEMAYLHPNYYKPDKSIRSILGLKDNEEYVLLRFNAFDAAHDAGIRGFSDDDKIRLVKELEKYAKVFISSETGVPQDIKDRVINFPKSKIHDVVYYAKLLVTDTQTMATESAILGTPVIRCNKFVGPTDMGNFIELEKKYGLMFNYNNPKKAINKAIDLIQIPDIKDKWKSKRNRLLKDKIDLTSFMVWFIENYPESFRIMKENPRYQDIFRDDGDEYSSS